MARFNAYKTKHPNATFIAKPDDAGQGDGIILFKELRELPFALEGNNIIV